MSDFYGSNVILIGLPTSGKSSVGIVLAKALGYDFIDGDLLIQGRTGKRLSEFMKERGPEAFLELEEEIHCELSCNRTVIAPGGSIVYSARAMRHLRQMGVVIYLKMELADLEARLCDARGRGVVLREGQTLLALYQERIPLYEEYADLTAEESGRTLSEMVTEILRLLREGTCQKKSPVL